MLITFTNANDVSFPIQGNYILSPDWSGFGDMPVSNQLSGAPYQDGKTLIDTIYNERYLTIPFAIIGTTRQLVFDRRRRIHEVFNAKLGIGTLKWQQDDGSEYHIDCIADKVMFAEGQGQSDNHQQVIISLLAPNPFWYDPSQYEQYLVGFDGGWSYPWSFPRSYGTVGTTITIDNTGTVSTPVYIEFTGEVVDPVITNETTGKELKIVKTIDDGNILIINTEFNNPYVEISSGGIKSNAMEYVDPESNLSDFSLDVGENVISYTATSEGTNAKGRLYYYHRFSGV